MKLQSDEYKTQIKEIDSYIKEVNIRIINYKE